MVGGAYRVGERFEVRAVGNLGLKPIFQDDFRGVGYKLRQISFTVGCAYKLKSNL